MVCIFELRDDRIVRETRSYPQPFEPPGWRAQWVERMDQPELGAGSALTGRHTTWRPRVSSGGGARTSRRPPGPAARPRPRTGSVVSPAAPRSPAPPCRPSHVRARMSGTSAPRRASSRGCASATQGRRVGEHAGTRPGGAPLEHRELGRTGVSVSTFCLGAMMFGAWATRTTPSRSGSSTPPWTPGSTSSTPPTSTRPASRRRSSARRSPAAGATTSSSPRRSSTRWARTRTAAAPRGAGSRGRSTLYVRFDAVVLLGLPSRSSWSVEDLALRIG